MNRNNLWLITAAAIFALELFRMPWNMDNVIILCTGVLGGALACYIMIRQCAGWSRHNGQ